MSKVKVCSFGISIDGYGAGARQDLQHPLGVRGDEMFRWFFITETFTQMHGKSDGTRGIDNDIAREGLSDKGAWILGRNMFGPIRGPWPDEAWKGWWGEEPPYHVPVFVLTHHARKPIVMKCGTTLYFVTDGIASALKQAKAAAGGKDVRIGGGVSTVRQYVTAGLVDEIPSGSFDGAARRRREFICRTQFRATRFQSRENGARRERDPYHSAEIGMRNHPLRRLFIASILIHHQTP